jgi:hypothetical protein
VTRYVLQIDGERREFEFFVEALCGAYAAVEQGAKRVLMTRASDGTPLFVMTPPEGS